MVTESRPSLQSVKAHRERERVMSVVWLSRLRCRAYTEHSFLIFSDTLILERVVSAVTVSIAQYNESAPSIVTHFLNIPLLSVVYRFTS